jgi:hypothetical protein
MAEIDTNTRVALLERGFDSLTGLLEKLDITIEKLTDVSGSIKQLLAVHEVKLEKHDEADAELYKLLDARKEEIISQNNIMNKKFSDLHNQFKEDMASVEKSLMTEIKEMRVDVQKRHDDSDKRTAELEKWRWVAIGAISVFIFYISKTNIFSLVSKLI